MATKNTTTGPRVSTMSIEEMQEKRNRTMDAMAKAGLMPDFDIRELNKVGSKIPSKPQPGQFASTRRPAVKKQRAKTQQAEHA